MTPKIKHLIEIESQWHQFYQYNRIASCKKNRTYPHTSKSQSSLIEMKQDRDQFPNQILYRRMDQTHIGTNFWVFPL